MIFYDLPEHINQWNAPEDHLLISDVLVPTLSQDVLVPIFIVI